MNRRIRALAGLSIFVASVVPAFAPPPAAAAAAGIDHQAAVIDSPGPGWLPSTALMGVPSGPILEGGGPAPAGWSPEPGSAFRGGWAKWFEAPTPPTLLGIIVGEYRDGPSARKANDNEAGLFEEMPVDLAEWADQPVGLQHGWAASAETVEGGVPVTTSVVAFTHGPLAVVVLAAGPAPGVDHPTLTAIARSQMAQVQRAVPADLVAAAESGLGVVDKVVLGALVGALAGGVGGVVRIRRRKGKQAASAYPRPGPDYGPAPYGGYPPPPPAGPGGFGPAAAPVAGFAHLPPPPSGWDGPAWSAPGSAAYPPPPPPPASGGFGPAPAPAPSAPVTPAEQPPCARCGQDFGRGAECASGCGAPRKSCVVCGTKIWAGALTCSAHSGQA